MKNHLLTILFLLSHLLNAQNITISGFVMGFKGEKVMMLRKAQKNVSFDGTIGGVVIKLSGPNSELIQVTNLSGGFSFPIKEKGKYKLSLRRGDYSGLDIELIYNEAGTKSQFESLYFLLKQEENSVKDMGSILIDNGGHMSFTPNPNSAKDDIFQSNFHLLEKACLINNSSAYASKGSPGRKEEKFSLAPGDTIVSKQSLADNNKVIDVPLNSNVDELKNKLNVAKKELSRMDPNSGAYKAMAAEIELMEMQLKDKQTLIELQEKELSASKKIIVFLCLFLLALAGMSLMLYYFFRQKRSYALALNEKSEKISRINSKLLSSIRYASLIQNGFLKDKNELRKLFRDAFIFNRPKDILSGDFYWFSQKNGHTIIAVADCTGHGVPGAMLTVLGHNALHDIVNVQGETVPSKILKALNKVINNTFSKNAENLEYGMDITIVSIKDGEQEFLLSGLANGLYLMKDGKLNYYTVSPKSFGTEIKDSDLDDRVIKMDKDDCFFLFSDGYQDQFSGNSMTVEKFNVERFEKLLSEVAKKESLKEAENHLDTTLQGWKGGIEQIDDILVLGFRI
jgi:serine phosphatase RsbU (regulator of sigma subunit)